MWKTRSQRKEPEARQPLVQPNPEALSLPNRSGRIVNGLGTALATGLAVVGLQLQSQEALLNNLNLSHFDDVTDPALCTGQYTLNVFREELGVSDHYASTAHYMKVEAAKEGETRKFLGLSLQLGINTVTSVWKYNDGVRVSVYVADSENGCPTAFDSWLKDPNADLEVGKLPGARLIELEEDIVMVNGTNAEGNGVLFGRFLAAEKDQVEFPAEETECYVVVWLRNGKGLQEIAGVVGPTPVYTDTSMGPNEYLTTDNWDGRYPWKGYPQGVTLWATTTTNGLPEIVEPDLKVSRNAEATQVVLSWTTNGDYFAPVATAALAGTDTIWQPVPAQVVSTAAPEKGPDYVDFTCAVDCSATEQFYTLHRKEE